MKFTKILFFLVLSLIIGFTSCKKEEISEVIKIEKEIDTSTTTSNQLVYGLTRSTSGAGLDLDCFSIDFPFELEVDGVKVTINSEEDFANALDPNTPQIVDFIYPLNITYPDGTTDSIADGNELGDAFASCIPSGGWGNDGFPAFLICDLNSCYQLVYPVSLVDENGDNHTANDEDEFVQLIVDHPELYFVFPVSLTDENGDVVVANDENDMFTLLATCDDIYNPGDSTYTNGGFACYDLIFPFDIINANGDVVTVANEDDFYNLVLNGDLVNFAYPFSLLAEDGTVIVINSGEELATALEACGGNPGPDPGLDACLFISMSSVLGGDCYDLVYPFDVVSIDGTVTTIADAAAAEALATNPNTFYMVQLPVSIVLTDTGETLLIDNEDDYFLAISDCDPGGPDPGLDAFLFIMESSIFGNDCYDLVYPFNAIGVNGTSVAIADATAAQDLINNPNDIYMIELPVSIVLIDSGETVSVENFIQFLGIMDDCN